MDYSIWTWRLFLGLQFLAIAASDHGNDSATILTGIPFYPDGFKHLTAITVSPKHLDNSTQKPTGLNLKDNSKLIISCDTDYDNQYLYFYDYSGKSISILENFNTSLDGDSIQESVFQNAASLGFSFIAVDWVNYNVYWTEPMMGRIMLKKGGKSNDTTAHYVVKNDLKRPRGIAVDPLAGYLFWTDIQTLSIGRASLTGENAENSLIYDRLTLPSGMVLDPAEQKIYWTERKAIFSATYDGTMRQIFYRYSYASFYDVSLFQDVIVATDIERYFAFFIDKNTGKEVADRFQSPFETFYGTCTYQHQMQPPPGEKEACVNFGCQDICVKEPGKVNATCLCRDGYTLNADKKTCTASGYPYHRGVVINTGDKLCIVGIHILSDHKDANTTCFYTAPVNQTISWFDLNMKTREVYFSMNTTIYTVPIDAVSENATVIIPQNYEIRGLTYDWMENLIFYALTTDFNTLQPESIWRVDPTTRFTVVSQMVTGLSPQAIAVAPHERKVFWVTGGVGNHTIEYTDLALPATAKISTITPTFALTNVSRMYHDVKAEALWVLDREFGLDYVTKIEYDGEFSRYLNVKNGLNDFALYKDYILIGYKEEGDESVTLQSMDTSVAPGQQIVNTGKLEGISNIVGIKVLDLEVLQPEYSDPCGTIKENGGCDQICLAEGEEAMCQCNLGYVLVNDKECKSYPVEDNFMLIADITYNEILQIPLDDPTNIIAIKTPSLGRPNGVMYNYERKILTWASEDYRQIWGMFLNGTGDFLITSLGFKYPDRVAYDPSSQLTFYSASSVYSIAGYSGFIGVLDSEGRELTLHSLADSPRAIVLHPEKGLLFYTDHGDPAGVFRMNMDGTNHTAIVTKEVGWPNGLAIDYEAERLYWTDGYLNKIFSCDYEGGKHKEILEDPSHLMALKFLDGYLYYSAWNKAKITKVKANDTSDVTLIGPNHSLGRIHAMDLYVAGKTDNVPIHPECSMNNGGCSHFCLPTPDGHSCGCETSYSLLNDLKTCENVPRCPKFIPTATVTDSDTCLRLGGNVCEFMCDDKYRPRSGLTTLTCTTQADPDFPEELLWDINDPCEEIFCPMAAQEAIFKMDCDRKVDTDCVMNYTCSSGYEKNMEVMEVKCGADGNWIVTKPLCIAKCPVLSSMVHHGVLHPDCSRDIGTTCKYFCDDKYKSSINHDKISCGPGSRWNVSIDDLCEEILCLDYIAGGVINQTCNRKVGDRCGYTCDFRFRANPDINVVTCGGDGKWNHGALQSDLLCTEIIVTKPSKSNTVAIAVGVSVGFLVLLIILVVLIFYMYRSGRLPMQKKPQQTTTSFENPRYTGDTAVPQSTEPSFAYTTLAEDKVELTTDSSKKVHAQFKKSPEHVYNDLTHNTNTR